MKKTAIFFIVMALGVIGVYTYTQLASRPVMIIDKTKGDASQIKIDLNIKNDKKEEIQEEKPEEIVLQPEELPAEIESQPEETIVRNTYTEFDLLKYMSNEQNYMLSPFSLKMALMMTANGSAEDTQKEILNAFGIEDVTEYNKKAEELINKYNSAEKVNLNVANSIWLNKDIALDTVFSEEFKSLISQYYKGEANEVISNEAVNKINSWVEEKTNGKIKNLIDSPDFLSVLVNTVYFKGEWLNQFDDYLTEKDIFVDINGVETEKDFMNKTDRFGYYDDETMQMLKMPYNDFKTSMYIAMPKINEELDYNKAIENIVSKKVNLTIPKFKVEYSITLNDILKQMGIEKAFGENANFSKMFTSQTFDNFFISQVLQKTFIDVDENGTEAAAATAVILKNTALLPQPEEIVDFVANKPFIYFIRDDESGEILFLGKILY